MITSYASQLPTYDPGDDEDDYKGSDSLNSKDELKDGFSLREL
jgi:hypothetical protein